MEHSASELHRFSFEGLPVHGVLVRLTDVWVEILQRQASGGSTLTYSLPVQNVLGELLAAALLMHSNIRYPGSLTLKISGDGPIKLAVAEVQSDLGLRATASLVGEVTAGAGLNTLVNLNDHGICAVTLKPDAQLPGQRPYQGVVPLIHDAGDGFERLSDVLSHYMVNSEQLETTLVLAANDKVAAGLLIQRLPLTSVTNLSLGEASRASGNESGISEDYNRIAILASSLKRDELLTLDGQTILHRLFWQESLLHLNRADSEPAPHLYCTCSHDRVSQMILGLGPVEAQRLLAELGRIAVGCAFCGANYEFDSADVAQVFSTTSGLPPTSAAC